MKKYAYIVDNVFKYFIWLDENGFNNFHDNKNLFETNQSFRNWALVNEQNIVEKVFYIPDSVYEKLKDKKNLLETSFNVNGGVYLDEETLLPHENQNLINETEGRKRKNFGEIGYLYNADLNAFIGPKPFPNWKLNTETCLWEPPQNEKVDGWEGLEYEYNSETNTGKFVKG